MLSPVSRLSTNCLTTASKSSTTTSSANSKLLSADVSGFNRLKAEVRPRADTMPSTAVLNVPSSAVSAAPTPAASVWRTASFLEVAVVGTWAVASVTMPTRVEMSDAMEEEAAAFSSSVEVASMPEVAVVMEARGAAKAAERSFTRVRASKSARGARGVEMTPIARAARVKKEERMAARCLVWEGSVLGKRLLGG